MYYRQIANRPNFLKGERFNNDLITGAYIIACKQLKHKDNKNKFIKIMSKDETFKLVVANMYAYKEKHQNKIQKFYQHKLNKWKRMKDSFHESEIELRCRICEQMVTYSQFMVYI